MSEAQPLVSIIIPTYNGSKRIIKTLNSVINQDYENIEIMLVDDVSTDNTVEVAQNFLEHSGRKFSIIKRTINGRQSASRNTGLKAANGKYVIFIDHDDLLEQKFVSALCNEITTKNLDIAFCNFNFFYETEGRFKHNEQLSGKNFSSPEDFIKAWVNYDLTIWGAWNFIFNKDFLNKNHLYFPEKCYMFEDMEFILKAVTLSSGISFVDTPLYTYVIHSEQQTQTDYVRRSDYKNFQQLVLVMWRIGRCILRHTTNNTIRNYVFSYCIACKMIEYSMKAIRAKDYELYCRIVKPLHHKKLREVMFSTIKFIFREPELFFKSLMLVYLPNFYYRVRVKK